ncbi:hypothetical protein PENTCL1PPCAC_24469, partial [Pristionchus entomophagus]
AHCPENHIQCFLKINYHYYCDLESRYYQSSSTISRSFSLFPSSSSISITSLYAPSVGFSPILKSWLSSPSSSSSSSSSLMFINERRGGPPVSSRARTMREMSPEESRDAHPSRVNRLCCVCSKKCSPATDPTECWESERTPRAEARDL